VIVDVTTRDRAAQLLPRIELLAPVLQHLTA
jgi:hypothetical protein